MDGMLDAARRLPEAARRRIEHQRTSGVRSSLFSAPAAAAARASGLEPIGEVFGCLVMNLGFGGVGCGWYPATNAYPMRPRRYDIPYTTLSGAFNPPAPSPVLVSGKGSRYAALNAYVQAYESAWYGALRRMLAEAQALGAHGVIGVQMEQTRIDGHAWEFTALGTAVRSTDPSLVPIERADQPWSTDLSAEDTASAILSGFVPHQQVLAVSVSTKHEDWQLRNERSRYSNAEITGMTELIQVARSASRARLRERATGGPGSQLVITDMSLREFESLCRDQEPDFHAESIITGTVLLPVPRFRPQERATVLSFMPLNDD